jgi:hypothetical protein
LTETINIVTTASNNQGVKLKSAATGLRTEIYNATANNIKVYPNTSDKIDNGTSNAPKLLPANASMVVVCRDSENWEIIRPLVIYDSAGNVIN